MNSRKEHRPLDGGRTRVNHIDMEHTYVKRLLSKERRKEQDPKAILKAAGIKKGMVVADLGCGPGYFTIDIASMVGKSGLVYAVDTNPVMLDYLAKRAKRRSAISKTIKVMHSDVSFTRIPSKSVDLAFFANVLHDIEDKAAFLKEVRRICRDGAVVVDLDWKKVKTEHGPPLEIRLSEDTAEKILSDSGYAVDKRLGIGPNHYMLLCISGQ